MGKNRRKKEELLAPPQEPINNEKPTKNDPRKIIEGYAEGARVDGFIQVGTLPDIFAHEESYSAALLDRLWVYFQCDRVPESRFSKKKYERWYWIFQRWCNMPDELWDPPRCRPISHLPLCDPKTGEEQKPRFGGRNDTSIVWLEALRKGIEKIREELNVDFPLPPLLFPEKRKKASGIAAGQGNKLDPEDFVRKLRIFYESDLEIKIQIPGQKAKVHSYSALGFRNADQKEWKDFLEIVKNPKHEYGIGQAYAYSRGQKTERRGEYDKLQKRMKSINTKLLTFFNHVYEANLPPGFRFYESAADTPAGIYRFKFSEKSKDKNTASKYAHFTKEEIKLEIKRLSQLETTESAEYLSIAYRQAEALGVSKSEIGELLPDRRQEDIKYDPYEN